jgi:Flp pilus assembly protein TadG
MTTLPFNGRVRPRSTGRMARRARREDGQIIVIFALALVAMIAMVGLVLDGGSAFAQRRDEQSAADLAALAGANDYLLNADVTLATTRARAVAATNGFTHAVNGVTVSVSITTNNGAEVTVDISAPHRNNFSSIVGMPTWTVATTATAQSGIPDSVNAGGPIIFSIDAFGSNGQPLAAYGNPAAPFAFGEVNGDIPAGPGDIAWTNYGTGNLDSNEVRDIIGGTLVINRTLAFGAYIGQHNDGNHTTLYDDSQSCEAKPTVNKCLSGENIPVPVVDHNGNFQGWATFHVVSADKNGKNVTGYFVSPFVNERLTIKGCAFGSCPRFLGSPTLHLVN